MLPLEPLILMYVLLNIVDLWYNPPHIIIIIIIYISLMPHSNKLKIALYTFNLFHIIINAICYVTI